MICPCGQGGAVTVAAHRSKAVAFGAVSFYVDHSVTGRLSKFTYGITRHISYDPLNPEHVKREHSTFLDTSGGRRVPGYFETMVSRVCYPPHLLDPAGQLHYILFYRVPRSWRSERSDTASAM